LEWIEWNILTSLLAGMALFLAIGTSILTWRMRGILKWKEGLKKELKSLDEAAEFVEGSRLEAINLVRHRCGEILKSNFPELRQLGELGNYISDIAACFHPEHKNPITAITVGNLFKAAQTAAIRLEMILRRPGFQILRTIRFRHVRKTSSSLNHFRNMWFFKFIMRYQAFFVRVNQLRLVLLPDPFLWLIYFSNQWTLMTLTRFLLLEIYLFMGQLAIETYDCNPDTENKQYSDDELLQVLKEIETLGINDELSIYSELKPIRNRLVGFNTIWGQMPGLDIWKQSLQEAIRIISTQHFPDSPNPVEEVSLGPLLKRTVHWLNSIMEIRKYLIVKYMYEVELATLIQVKSLTDIPELKNLGVLARKSLVIYGWIKWPLKIFQRAKKFTAAGVAMDIGWLVARKSFINFCSRKVFDLTCKEFDLVYRLSVPKTMNKKKNKRFDAS
jgi:hypothetical protein